MDDLFAFDPRGNVDRLAEDVLLDVRVVNAPVYRLLGVEIDGGAISGMIGLVPFVEYALTMDLLERELIDAIKAGRSVQRGGLPMRDRYLPDLATVVGVGDRLCAGGVVGRLCGNGGSRGGHGGAGQADAVARSTCSHAW